MRIYSISQFFFSFRHLVKLFPILPVSHHASRTRLASQNVSHFIDETTRLSDPYFIGFLLPRCHGNIRLSEPSLNKIRTFKVDTKLGIICLLSVEENRYFWSKKNVRKRHVFDVFCSNKRRRPRFPFISVPVHIPHPIAFISWIEALFCAVNNAKSPVIHHFSITRHFCLLQTIQNRHF